MRLYRFVLLIAVAALTVAGCGSSGTASTSTPTSATTATGFTVPKGTATGTTGETTASEPAPTTTSTSPSKLAPQNEIESNAHEICKLFGTKAVAKEYGGDPADPSSVAEAYTRGYTAPAKAATLRGCLAGLLASKKP